jgi:isoquinoline 1-oxidoreductase beta subunit
MNNVDLDKHSARGSAIANGVSRRLFIKSGAAAGGGFLLGLGLARISEGAAAADTFAPDAFIRVDRTGRVTLIVSQVEMGQGTYTSMPMLVAEELEVDLAQIVVEHAPPDEKHYLNPAFGIQATGGSTSVRAFWEPLRRAGAVARTMLIAAAADTWKVDPNGCRAEKGMVVHMASGRRVGYGALVERAAAQAVPQLDKITLKDLRDFTLVGTPVRRLDTPDKVNGKAEFGIDTKIPGMKIATVAACPVIGGKLSRVDDAKARAVKGVRQIVRLDDAVAVVADHMWAAKKGLAALAITWEPGPNAQFSSADLVNALEQASKQPGVVARKDGDVAKAMAGAERTVETVYQQPLLAHATMEAMNCTVHVRPDRCEVWVGTQVMARAQATAAEVTGLPAEKIIVHNRLLGGGFGRRLDVDSITQAVQIARHVDGPVKVVWTREEDMQHDVYRPYYYDRLAAGLDRDGMPVAFSHRVTGSSILARWLPAAFRNGLDTDAVEGAEGPYNFPNLLIDYVRQEPPPGLTTGWWRGVGPTHNAFMVEGFIDELAFIAKKDPVAYRRALLDKAPRARAVLDLAAEKAGWGKPMPRGGGRGVSVIFAFGTYIAQIAEVVVSDDGRVRVTRIICAIDCGRVVNPDTVKAQAEGGMIFGITAALHGQITLKNGRVEQANFDTYEMLRINEAPVVEVHLVASTEAPGGMGEPATAAIAPAVVNAIFAATEKRLRKLPVDSTQLRAT